MRKFLKGDMGQVGEMAARITGSPDLYGGRGASASVNFVTCHDGFTLADLVSYNEKHNEANGESNNDGANDNNSWNCGAEGPTDDVSVNSLRLRQIKNALTMLLVCQGVPMLRMGDECGQTQSGNNNAYCHDRHPHLARLGTDGEKRRVVPLLSPDDPIPGSTSPFETSRSSATRHPPTIWHGTRPWQANWSPGSRVLAFERVRLVPSDLDAVYVAMNMYWESLEFLLPSLPQGLRWHVAVNTSMPEPEDIREPGKEPELSDHEKICAGGRSIMVLTARGN